MKQKAYLFLSVMVPSLSLGAAESLTIFQSVAKYLFLAMVPFFLVPQALLSLIDQGGALAFWQSLVAMVCMVGIEAYSMHRLLKVPCTKAVPRMIFINIVEVIIQLGTMFLLSIFFTLIYFFVFSSFFGFNDVATMTQNNGLFWPLALFGILSAIILFAVRVTTAYKIYRRFDPAVSPALLKRALICANTMSYIFLILVFLVLGF